MVLDYDVRVARHRLARKCILYLAALHEPAVKATLRCGRTRTLVALFHPR